MNKNVQLNRKSQIVTGKYFLTKGKYTTLIKAYLFGNVNCGVGPVVGAGLCVCQSNIFAVPFGEGSDTEII